MKNKLLPCPFCGGGAELTVDRNKNEVSISCNICPVLFHQKAYLLGIYRLKMLVIEAWNKRINNG